MTIFRGPGGTGSATSDSDTTEFQEFLVQSQAARDAAQVAQAAAEAAEAGAEAAAGDVDAGVAASAASATAAASSATAAAGSATSAASSATNTASSATNAASSATAAASSASSASTSATNAGNSATAAASSAADASASATSSLIAVTHFGTTPPSLPVESKRWVNTNDGREYIYINDGDSSQWIELSGPTSTFADSANVRFQQAGTGATLRTSQDKARESVSVKDFGAVGDYNTDDTAALFMALSAVGEGGVLFFPRGVYRVTQSFVLPSGVKLKGTGAPNMQIAPQTDDDKRFMRPGFKHLIPGSSIIFDGTATTNRITERTDRFSSFSYFVKTSLDTPNDISGLGLLMDMDVFTAGGSLTSTSTDNRSVCDVGLLIDDAHHCYINDVCVFGYWAKASLVVLSASSTDNPDYNFFNRCNFTGDIGVALLSNDTVLPDGEGLSGSTFVHCMIHDRTHHSRPSDPSQLAEIGQHVIFVDGRTFLDTKVAGHKFIGCSLRGTVEIPIKLDHCADFSLIGCTTEFTSNSMYSPTTTRYIVGTANTQRVSLNATRMFSSFERIEELATTIVGPLIIDEGSDGLAYIAMNGKGLSYGSSPEVGNDPIIQLTTDWSSVTRGWNIRYDTDTGNLDFNFDNTIKARLDSAGNITPNGRLTKILGGAARESRTISAGAITITGNTSYIAVANEGSASSDDLTTINGGQTGDIIVLTSFSSSQDVTVKDGTNIRLSGDMVLDNIEDTLMLLKSSSGFWQEIARSNNSV